MTHISSLTLILIGVTAMVLGIVGAKGLIKIVEFYARKNFKKQYSHLLVNSMYAHG